MNTLLLRHTLLASALLLTAAPLLPAQQPNPIPQHFHNIYPQAAEADAQVHAAMQLAAQQHKRVLLVFGADQCADCQAFETELNEETNHAQIAEHFLLVHIDVGAKRDKNLDLVHRFGIPIKQGIPAVAVTDGLGRVLHVESFERARNMGAPEITAFLNKWRG